MLFQAIRNNMTKACKCHGMSGSCTVKTCSLKMPTFREIGNMLKERFDGAVKVIPSNDGESFRPAMENIKPPTKIDLVYLEDSPSYCNFNRSLGSFGTKGRECSGKLQSEEGCDILCCRRGSIAYTSEVQENCNCKFKYCCNVECEICTTNKTTYFCLWFVVNGARSKFLAREKCGKDAPWSSRCEQIPSGLSLVAFVVVGLCVSVIGET